MILSNVELSKVVFRTTGFPLETIQRGTGADIHRGHVVIKRGQEYILALGKYQEDPEGNRYYPDRESYRYVNLSGRY